MFFVIVLTRLRQLVQREAVRDLLLERAHEFLLAREPVEVGVGVAEAHEVERLLAGELLVAGLQVDVRVVVVAAPVFRL